MYPSHYYMNSLYYVLSKSVLSQLPTSKFYPVSCTRFLSLFFFNEKIIGLQNFCCFLSVINKNQPQLYPCPLPLKPSLLSPHPTLLDCYRAPVWILWVVQRIPTGYRFYITAKIFRIVSQFLGRVLKEEIGVWNSQGGEKDKLFFPLHSLVLVSYTTQFKLCTRDYEAMYPAGGQFLLPENLLTNPDILECISWEWVW